MRSQLTDANITNINGNPWIAEYIYHDNGDMASRTITSTAKTDFTYAGNLMDIASGGESFDLDWDENGNMETGVSATLVYNWDNKLRSAEKGSDSIGLKYDRLGNRIFKDSSQTGARKYIIDIVGKLPTILLELDTSNNIKKTYIYANSEIIARHDGAHTANRYFYLHDGLGSIRQIINTSGNVKNRYTYNPFGETLEVDGTLDNAFKFTGQYFDDEIDEYFLRARMYDPHIYRFTSRDPVQGKFHKPLTLHVYLYCLNDPVNRTDPTGEYISARRILRPMWEAAWVSTTTVLSHWPITSKVIGPIVLMGGTAEAGFSALHILYIRSLQHIIMNVILYEDLGVSEEGLLPVGWDLLFGRY